MILYDNVFGNETGYIIHGDLHSENILDDGKQFWGIDPCGYVGPVEFEFVRFILNDLKRNKESGNKERFEQLINLFGRFVDPVRLVQAFIVDTAFIAFNSTFEHDLPADSLVDLDLLETAGEWLERYRN